MIANALRKQGVAIRGKLLCGTVPLNAAKVKIVDTDTGPDPDDLLDEGHTNTRGEFELNGSTRELTPIDPVLYVWHDCNDGDTPCQRKVTFKIPKKFIHSGTPTDEEWMDLGAINMQAEYGSSAEQRECSH